MTNFPGHDPEPNPSPAPRRSRFLPFLARATLVTGGIVVVGAIAAALYLQKFVQEDLSPRVAKSLSETFQRPVSVGEVQQVSFYRLRFGQSRLPATKTDSDRAEIEAIDVQFNPLQALFERELHLNVTLVRPQVYVEQDADGTWVATRPKAGKDDDFKIKLDRLQTRDAKVVVVPRLDTVLPTEPGAPTQREYGKLAKPVNLDAVGGYVTFADENQRIRFNVSGNPVANGTVNGNVNCAGDVNRKAERTKLHIKANDVLATDVDALVPLPVNLLAGRGDTDLRIDIPTPNDAKDNSKDSTKDPKISQPLSFDGTVVGRDLDVVIPALPDELETLRRVNGKLKFAGQNINFDNVRGRFGAIATIANGDIHTEKGYNLDLRTDSVTVANLKKTFDLDFPFAASGTFQSRLKMTGELTNPVMQGTAKSIAPARPERLNQLMFDKLAIANAQFNYGITRRGVTFSNIRAVPTVGGLVTGSGSVTFATEGGADGRMAFQLRGTDLPGEAIARTYGSAPSIAIGQVDADVKVAGGFGAVQTTVDWAAPQATYPGRGRVIVAGDAPIRFEDTRLLVNGGLVSGRGTLIDQAWTANVSLTGLDLRSLNPEMRGLLGGTGNLRGRTDDLSLAAIRGEAKLNFSEGISIITDPMTAAVTWLGDRVQVDNASAPNFAANGLLYVATPEGAVPSLSRLDLNVQLRDYRIADLPIPPTDGVVLTGTQDFDGKLTGSLTALQIAGQVRVQDGAVNQFAFAPQMAGNFRYVTGGGMQLDLTGGSDRLALNLDNTNLPLSFLVQRGEMVAKGQRQAGSDRLTAQVQNFPLRSLSLPTTPAGLVDGMLNGVVEVNLANLANPALVGEVAIATPTLGYLKAEQFTSKFRYSNGIGVLDNAELRFANSRYGLSATYSPTAETPFQGKLTTDQGKVEDLLTAFQWFEVSDFSRGLQTPTYGSAADLATNPVGDVNASLLQQLQRFSEVLVLRENDRIARENATFLPELSTLKGNFAGGIQFAVSNAKGLAMDIDLQGKDWVWDQFPIEQMVAKGKFANGQFDNIDVGFKTGDSVLAVTGSLGGDKQNANLRASNLPAAAVRQLLKLPLDVAGKLNAQLNVTGSLRDPNATGEITLVDGKLNKRDIPALGFLLGYQNARLTAFGNKDNPFRLQASVPYRFPFMTRKPEDGRFSITLDAENEGLALVSLFTDQVGWKEGVGKVELKAEGAIAETTAGPRFVEPPKAEGYAEFKDARISATALPEDLKEVNGRILFNTDSIKVESFRGRFSDGEITASGSLPILFPVAATDLNLTDPLTVKLDNLAMNLKGLYNGGVNGEMIVSGSALAPLISGTITLSNGRIFLPDTAAAATNVVVTEPTGLTSPPELRDLKLELGDRVLITREPILNFVAKGTLDINGPLDNLRPQGDIRLRSGQVNLFTTQFSLAQGYDSKATFSSATGLDPILDIRLITSVPEVTRLPTHVSSPFGNSTEIADTPPASSLGEIQSVRVLAKVDGPASQLANRLTLDSSPRRTTNEILALLGGNLVNNFGQDGNPTLAIASVAGSALLTNLQNLVSNTLGLTDFRLFPTTVLNERERSSALALGGELGLNITDDLSVSALQLLTVEEPTQFSVRYRINDRLLLRGSTNLRGDSRGAIEFETRF
jgi:translocation and assembly module TamB